MNGRSGSRFSRLCFRFDPVSPASVIFYHPGQCIPNLPYRWQGQILGVLGVLGPTRMDYARTVALVETTANLLTRSLSEQAA